jgi:hypothetical protein
LPEVKAGVAAWTSEANQLAQFKSWEESEEYPITVSVAGCRMVDWSDVELLHVLCESLALNAWAIRKRILLPIGPEFKAVAMLEALAMAEIIAQQVAFDGRAAEPHPVWEKWAVKRDFNCTLPLAGLAGRRRVHSCRELLEAIAEPAMNYSKEISKKVLVPLEDVNRKLELAEALVIAEAVYQRAGAEASFETTAGTRLFPGGRPETFLERQARECKFKVLALGMAGGS